MSSGSKKGTQICYPFSSESWQANPLQVPQRGLYGEKYPLTGHFYLSFNISLFIFPSESPVRDPPPCSLTGSPWTVILRLQSHWSTFHSFIHCIDLHTSTTLPSEKESQLSEVHWLQSQSVHHGRE